MIATGNQAIATLTWFSAIVLLLGGVAMASTLSAWYHRIYERTPPKGLLRHFVYQGAGVVAFTLYISAQVSLFDEIRPVGGRGLVFLLTFVTSVLFWWWSAYMLLYRRVPLRQMLPPAWQREAASPVLESSLRSSSPTGSHQVREAMARQALSWR